MRVLVVIERGPAQRFLVKLLTRKVIEEILILVNGNRYPQAMVSALTKGSFEKVVDHDELASLSADLILSEHAASWDLTNNKT